MRWPLAWRSTIAKIESDYRKDIAILDQQIRLRDQRITELEQKAAILADGRTVEQVAAAARALRKVQNHDGYDIDEVKAVLGPEHFEQFMEIVARESSVFSCGHRVNENRVEILCVHAADLHKFMEQLCQT